MHMHCALTDGDRIPLGEARGLRDAEIERNVDENGSNLGLERLLRDRNLLLGYVDLLL